MKRLSPHLLGLVAALLVASPAPAAAQPEPGAVVKEVRIEGTRRVEPDAVKAALATRAGRPWDPKRVDADVRAVMKLGFFSDVTVRMEGEPDAPVLVYVVAEKPTVSEWRLQGNHEISKDDLKESIEVKPFQVLDLVAVRKDVKKIQEKYVEKGFYLAEVRYELKEQPENQVAVVYVVDEKAKVQIKEIRFLGNEKVSRSDLLGAMLTKEGGLLSAVSSAGTYREDMFQRDLQALQLAYLDRGYVNAKVGKPTVDLSPDRRYLFVAIPVEEGDQFRIGKLGFSGKTLGEDARLPGLVKSERGAIFSSSVVRGDLQAVADVYRDRGYANANVVPMTQVDAKARVIDIDYEVQPGGLVRFERIEITGNTKTRDKVIRRELRIYEGELFSGKGMRQSKQRVTALGFFETVEITTRRGSSDDLLIATVEVKERSTGTFQLGAGFSSYENFVLTGQISQNNFFGWGQTLSLQLQWSSLRQLGTIQFVEPYFLDTAWTFAFDLYASEGTYTNFSRRAVGGNMTWGYELSGLQSIFPFAKALEDVRVFGTYTNETVSVTPAAGEVPLFNRYRDGWTSSVRGSIVVDKRDNRLFPSRGFYGSLSAEAAPPALAPNLLFGNQVNLFRRYAADVRFYHPVIAGIVFRSKLTLGYIEDWDEAHRVPISELYFVGGINSVRGYQMYSISPTLRVHRSMDDAGFDTNVGGNKQAILNLELELPFFESAGIRAVVFADAGNAFARGQWSDPNVSGSLYKSVGFGIRWMSPVGPLRFEWGIPLDRRKDQDGRYIDRPLDFQFTIGNFF
ncbi:MAG TPA: outer membrane protein assembly factor BamA [Anaeromyxobacteraceae bacterium]|nr:outer membrane protein assembly factor BamA [Anaeromyxobacteraceae bacterium]